MQQEFHTELDAMFIDFISGVSIKRLLHFAFVRIIVSIDIGKAITSNINDPMKAIADKVFDG